MSVIVTLENGAKTERVMKRILCSIALWACAFGAAATGPAAVRKQVEMTMLVTGTLDLETDGSVSSHALNQAEALPQDVVKLIGAAIPKWRFEPVLLEGEPAKARAKMSLRIVAKQQGDGNYVVSIRSAGFGEASDEQGESVTADKRPPPEYPEEAYQSGITGVVYLVIRVGRQGAVEDIVAEQVNLTAIGSEQQMKRGRDLLSRAALQKAKSWTFNPPTKGSTADAPFWSIRVPVEFQYADYKEAKYGQWEAYVPGPRQQPSWVRDHDASGSPDAVVAGDIYEVGKGPRLLTPLGQG